MSTLLDLKAKQAAKVKRKLIEISKAKKRRQEREKKKADKLNKRQADKRKAKAERKKSRAENEAKRRADLAKGLAEKFAATIEKKAIKAAKKKAAAGKEAARERDKEADRQNWPFADKAFVPNKPDIDTAIADLRAAIGALSASAGERINLVESMYYAGLTGPMLDAENTTWLIRDTNPEGAGWREVVGDSPGDLESWEVVIGQSCYLTTELAFVENEESPFYKRAYDDAPYPLSLTNGSNVARNLNDFATLIGKVEAHNEAVDSGEGINLGEVEAALAALNEAWSKVKKWREH